jgi:hypothetical protein
MPGLATKGLILALRSRCCACPFPRLHPPTSIAPSARHTHGPQHLPIRDLLGPTALVRCMELNPDISTEFRFSPLEGSFQRGTRILDHSWSRSGGRGAAFIAGPFGTGFVFGASCAEDLRAGPDLEMLPKLSSCSCATERADKMPWSKPDLRFNLQESGERRPRRGGCL